MPLDASHAEGFVLNQGYFNSGTWRRVHRATQFAPGEHEFIAAESMTYLAFFQGDERSGRPYETWTGTLTVDGGTALYKGIFGKKTTGVINCTSPDTVHLSCTEKIKVRMPGA